VLLLRAALGEGDVSLADGKQHPGDCIIFQLLSSLWVCLLHGHARELRTGFLLHLSLRTAAYTSSRCVSLFYYPKYRTSDPDLNPNTLDIHSFLFASSKGTASHVNNQIQTEISIRILPRFKADFSHHIQCVPISST